MRTNYLCQLNSQSVLFRGNAVSFSFATPVGIVLFTHTCMHMHRHYIDSISEVAFASTFEKHHRVTSKKLHRESSQNQLHLV